MGPAVTCHQEGRPMLCPAATAPVTLFTHLWCVGWMIVTYRETHITNYKKRAKCPGKEGVDCPFMLFRGKVAARYTDVGITSSVPQPRMVSQLKLA